MLHPFLWAPGRRPLLAIVMAALAAACGDNGKPTTPTTPTPTTATVTFSGTITPNGAATHVFTATASGTVTATLTSVGPDTAVRIGFALGTWNGALCQVVLANDNAVQGAVITGGLSSSGNLCVRIYDIGTLTEPATYEVQVVHPVLPSS
jgi:hypothetical protein